MIFARAASIRDAQNLFEWRNDEATRAASQSREAVNWADHLCWLEGVLANDGRHLYVCENAEKPPECLGTCRFDVSGDRSSAEVSINLNPAFRGRGLAQPLLAAAIGQFRADLGRPIELTATIRHSNGASIRLFLKNGFRLSHSDEEFNFYVG
jgi:RimJ/RimL family protein N-acetyltransferase